MASASRGHVQTQAQGPELPQPHRLHDETEFRNFIVWLEDQNIRHYRIVDRGNLGNITTVTGQSSSKSGLEMLTVLSRFRSHKKQLAGFLVWLLDLNVEIMLRNKGLPT